MLVAPAEDEEAEGEIRIDDEQDTEVEPVKLAPDPGQPTLRQIEDHRRAHLPYRLWCKWCVMGRGLGHPHKLKFASIIAVVALDYFFITSGGVKKRDELEYSCDEAGDREAEEARKRGEIVKCIAVRCLKTKAIFGHVVPCKGTDEDNYVVGLVVEIIEWLGHTRLILKADNEPALQSLVKRALEAARVQCKDLEQLTKEEPAKYESKSNGGIEVGIKIIRGLFRTLRCCLEARLDRTIPVTHALMPWLLEHTCLLLNALVRGEDGITAWARVRGRPFGQQLLGFSETVLYKLPVKGPGHNPDGNMGAQQREAVFLGYSRSSNTYVLGTPDGLAHSRSITRRPIAERWRPDLMAELKTTPWSSREKPQVGVRFQEPAAVPGEAAEAAAPAMPRRFRINQSDLVEYGYSEGCPQCQHMQRYGRARPGGAHDARCRDRILRAIGESEAGKQRLAAHEERVDRAIAERIEHGDRQAAAAPRAGVEEALPPASHRAGADDAGRAVLGGAPRGVHAEAAARPDVEAAGRRRSEEGPEAPWQDVPGGEQAPMTPTSRATGAPTTPTAADAMGSNEGEEVEYEPEAMDDDSMETEQADDMETDFIGSIGSLEPSVEDVVSELMLAQLGSSKSHQREQRRGIRRLVTEIFSPPRVTKLMREIKTRHILPGFAFDLTVVDPDDGKPWDLSKKEKRDKVRRLLRRHRPYVLIGSPMCTAFSTWQALNQHKFSDPEAKRRAKIEAEVHMRFVISLYYEQIENGRYFIHEHPQWATSWQLEEMAGLMEVPGVIRVRGDQCQYGAEIVRGKNRGAPVMKPTGFLTNSQAVAEALSKTCGSIDGTCSRRKGGRHQLCSGRHAKDAAVYPRGLCRAILKGITAQLKVDNLLLDGCYGVQVANDDAEILKEMYGPEQGYSGRYKDDLTGQVLKDDLVKQARAKELAYFNQKGVWRKVQRATARSRTGRPPISVRWVDVNKGDEINPNYRSRLVARQMKALDRSGQTYFAPAPPLEALRTVVSLAMTRIGDHQPIWDPSSPDRTQISLIDVNRAYFNAKIDEKEAPTFVELPAEDPDAANMCAMLLRHMYGTRMAADGWQEEYSTMLVGLGFRQGEACPNLFHHKAKQIVCSVHGDDFASSGPRTALDWLESSIQQHYEITIQPRIGPGSDDAKEGRALNRVIRWCDGHIEYEADPRQVERLVAECGLEGSKPVATPGVKPTFKQLEEDTPLPKHLHTAFRGAAARGNYLAADRIDGQFAFKEVCRWMANPNTHAWQALKRICRFLNSAPRLVYTYKQQTVEDIDVYVDTDWSGCPKTRKSTSGGCVLVGQHTLKHWSSTQASVALSSGEAEFAGVIRGAGQGLGYQALLKDLGVTAPLRVWTDSSAAVGICTRQGLGKMRHLDTHTLWIQQAVRTRRVDLRKVDGEQNPADLLTKHSLSRGRMEKLVDLFGCRYLGGRAASAPLLRKGESAKTTMAGASKDLGAVIGGDAKDHSPRDPMALGADVDGRDDGRPEPVMPHLSYSESQLNELHPRILAPEDPQLDDLADDSRDAVYQQGLKIAGEIQSRATREGRKRNPSETKGEDADELNSVDPRGSGLARLHHRFRQCFGMGSMQKSICTSLAGTRQTQRFSILAVFPA